MSLDSFTGSLVARRRNSTRKSSRRIGNEERCWGNKILLFWSVCIGPSFILLIMLYQSTLLVSTRQRQALHVKGVVCSRPDGASSRPLPGSASSSASGPRECQEHPHIHYQGNIQWFILNRSRNIPLSTAIYHMAYSEWKGRFYLCGTAWKSDLLVKLHQII